MVVVKAGFALALAWPDLDWLVPFHAVEWLPLNDLTSLFILRILSYVLISLIL